MNAEYYKKRWQAVFYCIDPHGPNYSYKKAASLLKISKTSVHRWVCRYKQTGTLNDVPKSGRLRATQPKHEKLIDRQIAKNPPKLVTSIQQALSKQGCDVTARTVQRRLSEKSVIFGPVTTKPLLSELHRQKRLQFAEENINRDWSNVIFTDEASFSAYSYSKKVWRLKGKKSIVRTVKHPVKVHAWGCFSERGFGKIYIFTGNLNALRMVHIYKTALLASAAMWFSSVDEWVLQEDNDPKHTATLSKVWKKDQKLVMLNWPASSPDLNPIENVWGLIKARLRENPAFSQKQLTRRLRAHWGTLSAEYAENLAKSCTKRMRDVLHRKGDFIIY